MSGIELQHALIARHIKLPIIFMTGYGDINESVHAIKAGAFDFVEKPVAPAALLRRVEEALALDRSHRESESSHCTLQKRFDELTPREKEVIAQVVTGKTNKVIARELDISFRTVEKHRASAMQKLDLDNVVELAKLVQRFLPDVL
jgi:FixJ family two-component response regulator